MSAHAYHPFPRAPLIGAGTLVAAALVFALVGRLSGMQSTTPTATIVAQHELRFQDRPGGSIAVFSDGSSEPTAVVGSGTNGFLRGTMRALARDRIMREIGPETPFRVTAWSDGRLTIEDPVVGRLVDLEAFGPTNAGAFAKLIGVGVAQ